MALVEELLLQHGPRCFSLHGRKAAPAAMRWTWEWQSHISWGSKEEASLRWSKVKPCPTRADNLEYFNPLCKDPRRHMDGLGGEGGLGACRARGSPCPRRLLQGILHHKVKAHGESLGTLLLLCGRRKKEAAERLTHGPCLLSGLPAELVTRKCPCSGSSTHLERVLPPFPSPCCLGKTTFSNTGFIQAGKIKK